MLGNVPMRPSAMSRISGLFQPTPGSLLSPAADILMGGGASILFFLCMQLLHIAQIETTLWAGAIYYASFLVNYPHFAASYQLLYIDTAKDFLRWRENRIFTIRLWWAGLFVPVILASVLIVALAAQDMHLMGWMVNAMYFFVGWHYVKQIFGCVIVFSAARKIFLLPWERWIVLAAMYALWILRYVASNTEESTQVFTGIPYKSLDLPDTLIVISAGAFIITTLLLILMLVFRSLRRAPLLPLPALTALLSIYVWFTPVYTDPHYLAIIPFFHSLQYLLFVLVYKRNEALSKTPADTSQKSVISLSASIAFLLIPALLIVIAVGMGITGNLESVITATYGMIMLVSSTLWLRTVALMIGLLIALFFVQRAAKKSAMWYFWRFGIHMLLLGTLLFSIIPTALDILATKQLLPSILSYDSSKIGASFYLFAFFIFINIHHYFIDNVIWKRENPHVREHLFH